MGSIQSHGKLHVRGAGRDERRQRVLPRSLRAARPRRRRSDDGLFFLQVDSTIRRTVNGYKLGSPPRPPLLLYTYLRVKLDFWLLILGNGNFQFFSDFDFPHEKR
jgi:hypothetical protein